MRIRKKSKDLVVKRFDRWISRKRQEKVIDFQKNRPNVSNGSKLKGHSIVQKWIQIICYAYAH